MIQGLFAFLPFLKEMLFGTRPDDPNRKPMGKWSKLMVYGLIVASLTMNYFMFKKIYALSVTVVELRRINGDVNQLREQVAILEAQNTKLTEILGDIVTGRSSNIKNLAPQLPKKGEK